MARAVVSHCSSGFIGSRGVCGSRRQRSAVAFCGGRAVQDPRSGVRTGPATTNGGFPAPIVQHVSCIDAGKGIRACRAAPPGTATGGSWQELYRQRRSTPRSVLTFAEVEGLRVLGACGCVRCCAGECERRASKNRSWTGPCTPRRAGSGSGSGSGGAGAAMSECRSEAVVCDGSAGVLRRWSGQR